jgi:hypothetical protein
VFFGDYKPFFQKATLGKCLVGDNIFSCSLSNKTSEKKDLRIDLDLDSSHNKGAVCAKKTISLAPGQSSSVDLNYKINQGGEYSLKFRISDSGSGETIFRSSSYPISIPEINPVIKSLMLKTENAIKALGLGEEKDTGAAFSCQLEKLKDKLSTYANELKNVSDYSSWNLLKLKLDAVSRELDFVLNRIKCYKQAKKINKNVEYGVGVESSLRKVFKDEIFHGDLNPELSLSAASNEYESGQLVLIPFKNDLDDVTVKVSDLVHCDAPQNVIPESSIKWYAVDYVKTGMPGAYSSEKVGFWPDILMEKTPFSVKRDELRPVWITVYVPENTVPGKYRGVLTIAPANAPETKVPVSLKVWNFSIPKEASLPVTVSLSKWLLSQYYYGDYKRSFPIDAYRSFADMLLKHRISPFGIAVECIGPRGEFINKNLDLAGRELQFAFDNGLAAFQIAQYWHMRPPSAADLKRLKLFSEYLEGKGWLDKGSVYVTDEPPHSVFPIVKKMCEQIKKVNPQLKTAVTTAPSPELFGCIDIWITNFIHFDSRIANEIVKKGDEIWWYVCATQGNNPNLYIDFPALSHRLIFWLAWQNNVSGFLYYRANFWRNNYTGGDIEKRWPKTPWNPVSYMDIHGQKYNGDGYLLYPGPDMRPVNSIRLEVIRDGIEDYEYLHALQELTEKLSSEKNGNDVLLQRAKHILKAIKGSYDKNDQKHPEKVAKMIKDRESLGDCISAIRSSLDR